jgi:hypothetical protein
MFRNYVVRCRLRPVCWIVFLSWNIYANVFQTEVPRLLNITVTICKHREN